MSRPEASAGSVAERESLLTALRQGRSLTAGLVAEVRDLLEADDITGATAVAGALTSDPSTRPVGDLCFGIVSFHRGFNELAWHHFRSVPLELWARYAAFEYVRAGLGQDEESVLGSVRDLLAERPAFMNAKRWLDIVGPVFGAGARELAEELVAVLDDTCARQPGLSEGVRIRRAWIQRWIHRSPDSPTAPSSGADVSFAIMNYDHPSRGRASANIGDHVQTLASLGHLVRHQDLSFRGEPELVDLVERLQHRVRPEARRTGHSASVQVLTVNRDATMYDEVPEHTWTLAFGWYMHALFGLRYGFPFHKNLQPIFVSFHCNKHSLLTPEVIEYLREHGPVGCRDWTTVDILLSLDVPAFFSGCLTTTVDSLYPDLAEEAPRSASVAYVDSPAEASADAVTYGHTSDAVRLRSFTDNLDVTVDLLETYRRHSAVVTSRLHCYLPMRSLGSRIDFRPKSRSDIRFAGLIDLTDEQFAAMRTDINHRLEKVFDAILDGGSREEVYRVWRELCAADVDLARRRLNAPAAVAAVAASSDMRDEIRRAVAGSRTVGTTSEDAVHVAIRVGEEDPDVLDVLVDSLADGSSRPLHIWLLDRTTKGLALDESTIRDRVAVTVVPVRELGAGLHGLTLLGRERPRAGFEVLLLPQLLPDVARVVVVPVAAVLDGDLGELADLDLEGHLLAAPEVAGRPEASGFGVIHGAANRLDRLTTVATELRRRAQARHTFDFPAFDTNVLVLDLERLRETDMTTEAAALVEEFDLTAREALHFLVGPEHAVVPGAWHCVPTRDHRDHPALVHWDDPARPWTQDYAPEQERWLERRRRMRLRHASAS